MTADVVIRRYRVVMCTNRTKHQMDLPTGVTPHAMVFSSTAEIVTLCGLDAWAMTPATKIGIFDLVGLHECPTCYNHSRWRRAKDWLIN